MCQSFVMPESGMFTEKELKSIKDIIVMYWYDMIQIKKTFSKGDVTNMSGCD